MTIISSQLASQIREYIAHNMLFSDYFEYDDDTSFLEERIVDSLGILELITFVEHKFGISVADHELTPENFDSVRKIADYVGRKLDDGRCS